MIVTENLYWNFFNLSVDMLCVAGYDGYFKDLNPAWTRTLGFTQAELMDRPYLDFVHPEDRPATVTEAEKLAKGATTIHFRNRYECRDGTYRWLAWAAMPSESAQLIYAVARDITQEVEAESELRTVNAAAAARLGLLTALVDAIGIGVLLVDRDLRVAHWNKETTRLTGIPMENALGSPARKIGEALAGRVADYQDLQSHFQQGLTPAEAFSFPIVMLNPHRELEVSVSRAVSEADGQLVGSVLVLSDVTAAKELERAKDELIAMVSHELRTPLASLVGFTELLLERQLSDAQRKQYLETMLKEGNRLTALITDFLDLQGLEGGYKRLNLGPADLRTVINRAVQAAGQNPQTPIEVNLPAELPLVIADTNAIHQVLLNMISNARKYSPGGGTVAVSASVIGDLVEVSIRDHGLGIPADALPKLFNKFYRVGNPDRRQISGTGLGLAISRRIIEGHGGLVRAESEGLGHGSRFTFGLRPVSAAAKSGDVLIVEDDVGFARLIEAELAANGLTSVWAPDAETADQLAAQMSSRAMVVDLVLPGASGEEFIRRLRSVHHSAVPVVVISIKELEADEMLALRTSGVAEILKKHSGAAKDAAIFVTKALSQMTAPSG
ncbi:MAG: hybrid sensor histidine kinase/response regulator [Candidatus Dormibacteraceae bacterium]